MVWQISFSITYPKALNLGDEISLRGKGCNIPDVTVTKIGSCHHEHCIAYLLSTSLCINLKQVYFDWLCLGNESVLTLCVMLVLVAETLGWKVFEKLGGENPDFWTLELPPFEQFKNQAKFEVEFKSKVVDLVKMHNFGFIEFLKFQHKIQSNLENTDFQKVSPFPIWTSNSKSIWNSEKWPTWKL